MQGGKRKGAGRPRIEPSKVVRVPEGILHQVEAIIEKYKAERDGREYVCPDSYLKYLKNQRAEDLRKAEHDRLNLKRQKEEEAQVAFDSMSRNDRKRLIKLYGSKASVIRYLAKL